MGGDSISEKLDLLVFAAHPDDAELCTGGLIAKMVRLGHKVGIVDLTTGQMGTRGSVAQREEEAVRATKILGLTVRDNLGLIDGELSAEDPPTKRKVVEVIRKYRPTVVLAGLEVDRHPDHYRGGQLVSDAAWLADRIKYDTDQVRHQVKRLCYYPQHYVKDVSFVVDISEDFETKLRAVLAFSTQLYQADSKEPTTAISSKDFMDFWKARARYFGGLIGRSYGEPYFMHQPAEIFDPVKLWS